MFLSIEFSTGTTRCERGHDVIYDITSERAYLGRGSSDGPALRWRLSHQEPSAALLCQRVHLKSDSNWIVRCDRVDFPPSSVAYRHTHPGPGIRCTLFGGLTIEAHDGNTQRYGQYQPWFEAGPEPVLATADADTPSAFVRVMLLPEKWLGQRTIHYVDPADADRPKRQRPTVFFDEPLQAVDSSL